MDCKRALQDAEGNFESAKKLIQERGLAKVEKRADRETGAGLIKAYIHNERIGVLLDVRAETDFVVRSEPFKELAQELVMQIAAMEPKTVEELLEQPYVRDESRKVNSLVQDVIARVGENVRVNRFVRYEV
jgi:elongation factor Ts